MSQHADEPHTDSLNSLLNRLRAAVLGANDGIVSVAGIVMGFAGATADRPRSSSCGVAGLVAGALSMAAGEYVSVSSQRDTERALIHKETRELRRGAGRGAGRARRALPAARTVRRTSPAQVALELTEKDALRAHLDIELGIDPDELTSPWQAAVRLVGLLHPRRPAAAADDPARSRTAVRAVVTLAAVTLALACTGFAQRPGRRGAGAARPSSATSSGGLLAMGVTYGIGTLAGIGAGLSPPAPSAGSIPVRLRSHLPGAVRAFR